MKIFDFEKTAQKLLTPNIVKMLSIIHEHKGKQELYITARKDNLTEFLEIAKIQSTGASNRIEGIFTTDKRLEELVKEKSKPRNRNEKEIAGYRDVLNTIHESYDFINISQNIFLQFHRDLYSYTDDSFGGKFKSSDNIIAETDINGKMKARFIPLSAFETPTAIQELCDSFLSSLNKNNYDPLLLISIFILDFLCIHPFDDGNGRMSRLLTLLFFYKQGYIVGKYISIEMLIEKSKETYYEVLQQSSFNWKENQNDYEPFVSYYLGVIIKAYSEFEDRVEYLQNKTVSKPERIKLLFDKTLGKVSKNQILEYCPDISESTIERTLSELLSSGYIKKVGGGRSTAYVKA